LRPKEAAPFFGQTARWVRDRMRDGSIKTVKVGPTEFIPIDELDRIYEGEGA
jgi:hypothetical protein